MSFQQRINFAIYRCILKCKRAGLADSVILSRLTCSITDLAKRYGEDVTDIGLSVANYGTYIAAYRRIGINHVRGYCWQNDTLSYKRFPMLSATDNVYAEDGIVYMQSSGIFRLENGEIYNYKTPEQLYGVARWLAGVRGAIAILCAPINLNQGTTVSELGNLIAEIDAMLNTAKFSAGTPIGRYDYSPTLLDNTDWTHSDGTVRLSVFVNVTLYNLENERTNMCCGFRAGDVCLDLTGPEPMIDKSLLDAVDALSVHADVPYGHALGQCLNESIRAKLETGQYAQLHNVTNRAEAEELIASINGGQRHGE